SDIDRVVCRAQQGNVTPRELLALCRALDRLGALKEILEQWDGSARTDGHGLEAVGDTLPACGGALSACTDLVEEIRAALVDEPPMTVSEGGFIRSGYAADIDAVDSGSKEA